MEAGDRLMPFGKYVGKKVSELSDGYLLKLYDNNRLPDWLREYAENTIPILYVTKNKNK